MHFPSLLLILTLATVRVTLAALNTITFNDALYDLESLQLIKWYKPRAGAPLGYIAAMFDNERANAFACAIYFYESQFSQPTDWVSCSDFTYAKDLQVVARITEFEGDKNFTVEFGNMVDVNELYSLSISGQMYEALEDNERVYYMADMASIPPLVTARPF